MLLHNTPLFRIYFGDAKDALLSPDEYLSFAPDKTIFDIPACARLKELMRIDQLIFLRQKHSADGLVITSHKQAEEIKPFTIEGDYLITNVKSIGVGVMTADCLPVVFFDNFNRVVATVHAGWRGSAKNIVLKAVDRMMQEFGTKPESLQVFFGPSAKVCCYTIGEDMLESLEDVEIIKQVVQRRGKEVFFDLPVFNKLQLESIGVKPESFKLDYNVCTICDPSFYSHRRQGKKTGRQMTVVSLC